MPAQTYHRAAKEAFDDAIESHFLSNDSSQADFAGHWMYMHSTDHADLFKNIDTRRYIEHTFADSLAARIQQGKATLPCASLLDN